MDFHIEHNSPIVIYCGNKSTPHIVVNHVFHERTQHIEMDWYVVRDKVQAETIHLLLVASKKQVADIMTKSLHIGPFTNLQNKLVMIDIFPA